ncbi:MAG TPA: glycosyltransferase family 39 protein [Labilithrix sp.]|nr:glycosyltransferase family 39 protein [Labilithrix sp.]
MTRRDALVVTGVALAARLAVVAWAASAIPPAADGTYYHLLAGRIASGQGYTWLWPDGVVTYAAHYPVGYPALLALAYAALGAKPAVAMLVNALLGAAGAWASFDLLARVTPRRLALAGGLAVALHPALVPYTAALMTEGVTAALLVIATAFAARARDAAAGRRARGWILASGLVLGLATLVRPQSLALAPLLGWLAVRSETAGLLARLRVAAAVAALAVAVCAPWTARNCRRMERCALVSVNGGWNLAIGTQTTDGGWREMAVPDACKEVFAEASKDACFGDAARGVILRAPLAWLARAPAKLHMTFDYLGAAPWYLHAASAERFPYRAKVALGSVEVLVSRLLLIAALVAVRKLEGARRLGREAVTALGLVACLLPSGAVFAYLACAVGILMVGRRRLACVPLVVPATAGVILATAATHAVFFGSGRYGLVVVPFVTALAFIRPIAKAA